MSKNILTTTTLALLTTMLVMAMATTPIIGTTTPTTTSYAQPATTTTTPPLSQNDTTSSSSPVDEGVIINSLVFNPDGTGWLRLNNDGTIGPIMPFTHNFTEANGYTIYSSVPFFANNGSTVDLNSIDFSTEIIMDPSANMTLPARPILSPSANPDISSLPPPSSQIEASPSITTPPIPATPPTTPSTTTQTQDPDFERFIEIAGQCANSATFGSSGATMTQEQCTQFLEQGQEKWCGLAAYDAQKCDQATKLTAAWNNMVNLSERYGLSDIPSLGELGIDPRTIVP